MIQAKLITYVVDEYGNMWDIVGDDMQGNYMVQSEEEAGVYSNGELTIKRDGDTFSISCENEFVVDDDVWFQNA